MTFRDVVFKNFRGNLKQYVSYFLCSTYTIMIFFMFSLLLCNQDLKDQEVLEIVFPIVMVAIAVFAVFFITYAHTAFLKGRNKEFGIYISLGMDIKELKRMVTMENTLICSAALVSGMAIGGLFSRLFQMIILSLLQIEDIKYRMSYKAFLLTIGVFIAIFIVVFILSSIRMNHTDITSLLRESRKREGREYARKDTIFGVLGLLLLACSILIIQVITKEKSIMESPIGLLLFAVPGFTGVYLMLTYGGNLILHLIKQSKFYFTHMLELTEIHHRFHQNKKIIFILSILSTMTVFFVASPFSLLSLSEKLAEKQSHHIEFASTIDRNVISEDGIHALLDKTNAKVREHATIPILFLYDSRENQSLDQARAIMSVEEYNKLVNADLQVESGKTINIHANWMPGTFGIEVGKTYSLYGNNQAYDFMIQSSGRGEWIVQISTLPVKSIFLVEESSYRKIYQEVTEGGKNTNQIATIHTMEFENWKDEKDTVEVFENALVDETLPVVSVEKTYLVLKQGYSVFFFVAIVLGILFFVSGGGVLYFKQFTELAETRKTFERLFKIGITEKEMRRVIGNELRVIFFLPLVFGTFMGIGLIRIMTFMMGGGFIVAEFIRNAWIVVGIYFVSQNLFYYLTKKKYIGDAIKAQ